MQEKMRHANRCISGKPSTGTGPGNLEKVQAAGDAFLTAGLDAINRALSQGKSEEFLRMSRQQGGQ